MNCVAGDLAIVTKVTGNPADDALLGWIIKCERIEIYCGKPCWLLDPPRDHPISPFYIIHSVWDGMLQPIRGNRLDEIRRELDLAV